MFTSPDCAGDRRAAGWVKYRDAAWYCRCAGFLAVPLLAGILTGAINAELREKDPPRKLPGGLSILLLRCSLNGGISNDGDLLLLFQVILDLMDFQSTAFRTRPAGTVKATRANTVGGLVGLTLREAILGHCWGNATLIGVDDKVLNHPVGFIRNSPGVVADPDRKIEADDHLIFISKTSTPLVSQISADRADFAAEAAALALATTDDDASSRVPTKNVLVCGWRQEWDKAPARFTDRCRDIIGGLGPESTITTFNLKSAEDMASMFTPELGWESVGHGGFRLVGTSVTLLHICGDPTDHEVFEKVISDAIFCTAIVLGSSATLQLNATARDSRVLQILLVLRMVSEKTGRTMHVVAENSIDQTSSLSLGPHHGPGQDPDFVNTQAIVARSLVMNLAFPQIWDSLSELFSRTPTGPEIVFLDAGAIGLAGKTCTVGALQHLINGQYNGCGVVLGYFSAGDKIMSPPPGQVVDWMEQHRIIAIIRIADYKSLDSSTPASTEEAPGKPLGSTI